MRKLISVAGLIAIGIIAGCGGSGGSGSTTQTTPVSGVVADGYLQGAEVFLDMNGNYQWDAGEPKTTTGPGGAYTLMVPVSDAARFPVVARAIAGTTVDEDTNTTVSGSYVMSAPAGATGFVSPMSSLLREKMAANPGMTMADAMTQLRNQLNMPIGINMLGNYVAGSLVGTNTAQYQAMRSTAQQMAGLMAGEAPLVMNGSNVNMNRYRSMMGTINTNMPSISTNAMSGLDMNSSFMTGMRNQMQTQLAVMPISGGFMNFSGMFRNMTSHQYFWNYSGGQMRPGSGSGMMR
jgi:hypothetical protein